MIQRGKVNQDYKAYITNLCNELRANGIKSIATIFNNDLPKEFKNGWTTDEVFQKVKDENYIELLANLFGTLVDEWITFENAQTEIIYGLTKNSYPPAFKGTTSQIEKSFENIAAMHNHAYDILKSAKITLETLKCPFNPLTTTHNLVYMLQNP